MAASVGQTRRRRQLLELPVELLGKVVVAAAGAGEGELEGLLLSCRTLSDLAMRHRFGHVDLDRRSSVRVSDFVRLFDTTFERHILDTSVEPPAVARQTGPLLRYHVRSLRVKGEHWPSSRHAASATGMELAQLPSFFQLARDLLPGLTHLTVRLPNSNFADGPAGSVTRDATKAALEQLRLSRLESLRISLRGIDNLSLRALLQQNPPLRMLSLSKAFGLGRSLMVGSDIAIQASSLTRLCLERPLGTLETVDSLCQHLLSLSELVLQDVSYFDRENPLDEAGQRAIGSLHRVAETARSGGAVAPIERLTVRLAYRDRRLSGAQLSLYCALLSAMSTTLRILHVSKELGASPFFLPVLFDGLGGAIESLKVGFFDIETETSATDSEQLGLDSDESDVSQGGDLMPTGADHDGEERGHARRRSISRDDGARMAAQRDLRERLDALYLDPVLFRAAVDPLFVHFPFLGRDDVRGVVGRVAEGTVFADVTNMKGLELRRHALVHVELFREEWSPALASLIV